MRIETQPERILDEARSIVFGAREQQYGHPRDDFREIAALWNGWLAARSVDFAFKPEDVADLMILLKMARLKNDSLHRDSHVDIAGYAQCRARVVGLDV